MPDEYRSVSGDGRYTRCWTLLACVVLIVWNIGLHVHQGMLDNNLAEIRGHQDRASDCVAQVNHIRDTGPAHLLTHSRTKRSVPEPTADTQQNVTESTPVQTKRKEKKKLKKFPAIHLTLNSTAVEETTDFGVMTNEGLLVPVRELLGWQAANWSDTRTLYYTQSTGRVTVLRAGTYILYGQILFHNKHPAAAFGIHVNDVIMPFVETKKYEEFLYQNQNGRRRRSTPDGSSSADDAGVTEKYSYMRRNTIAVYYLEKGDQVFLRTTQPNMTLIQTPCLSFWGMAKLGKR